MTPDATPMSLRRRGSLGDEDGERQSVGETGMVHSLSASNLQDYELNKMYVFQFNLNLFQILIHLFLYFHEKLKYIIQKDTPILGVVP